MEYFDSHGNFVCPHCEIPNLQIHKGIFPEYMKDNPKYCMKCGKQIEKHLKEALASVQGIN